jgi:hypothetical protein
VVTGSSELHGIIYRQVSVQAVGTPVPAPFVVHRELKISGEGTEVRTTLVFRELSISAVKYPEPPELSVTVLDSKVVLWGNYDKTSPTYELYGSNDGATFTKIGTTNNQVQISNFNGYSQYKIVANHDLDGDGIKEYSAESVYTGFQLPPNASIYWAGTALNTTDLALVGAVLDGSEIVAKLDPGVAYLPNGFGYWIGSGDHYAISTADFSVLNPRPEYYPVITIPFSTLIALNADFAIDAATWPVSVYTIRDEEQVASHMPTYSGYFIYDTPPTNQEYNTAVRVPDPGLDRQIDSIPVRNWNTGIISDYSIHGSSVDFDNIEVNQFVVDWANERLVMCLKDYSITGMVHICIGKSSLVSSRDITAGTHRIGQSYLILKDSDRSQGANRLCKLLAEVSRGEAGRAGMPTQLTVYALDETDSPVSNINISITNSLGSGSLAGTTNSDGLCVASLDFITAGLATIKVTATDTLGVEELSRIVRTIYYEVR